MTTPLSYHTYLSSRPLILKLSSDHYSDFTCWYLDHIKAPYVIEKHSFISAPPVLVTTDRTLKGIKEITTHFEKRLPAHLQLTETADYKQDSILNLLYDQLGTDVLSWLCFHLSSAGKLPSTLAFQKAGEVSENTAIDALARIETIFEKIAGLIKDGRKYIRGEKIGMTDIAWATLAAPLLLPERYQQFPAGIELPQAISDKVKSFRNHPAGKFILTLYASERPESRDVTKYVQKITRKEKLKSIVSSFITGYGAQRLLFSILRRFKPVLFLKNFVILTRYKDVESAFKRSDDFTVAEVNALPMKELQFYFILGMDKSAQREKEMAFIHAVIKRSDLETIQKFIHTESKKLLAINTGCEQIDLVNAYARPVICRFVAHYFGLLIDDEPRFMHWMRILFYQCFLNLTNDQEAKNKALEASLEFKTFLEDNITRREKEINDGNIKGEDLLTRMLLYKKENDWADYDVIRRNLSGNMLGAHDTSIKVFTHVMSYLLKRPKRWQEFGQIVATGDIKHIAAYWMEALRFKPHHTILRRYAAQETTIAGRKIPAGSEMILSNYSAVFDKRVFKKPHRFIPGRQTHQMHFGYGEHECAGSHINKVTISELLACASTIGKMKISRNATDTYLKTGAFPDALVAKKK